MKTTQKPLINYDKNTLIDTQSGLLYDKLTVITDEETIVRVCKKLFRWRKDIYKRFTNLGIGDYDRVIYQIYQINNWGKKI